MLTGMFGALLFVSSPFQIGLWLLFDVGVKQSTWEFVNDFYATQIAMALNLGSTVHVMWVTYFLVGFLIFALSHIAWRWWKGRAVRSNLTVKTSAELPPV